MLLRVKREGKTKRRKNMNVSIHSQNNMNFQWRINKRVQNVLIREYIHVFYIWVCILYMSINLAYEYRPVFESAKTLLNVSKRYKISLKLHFFYLFLRLVSFLWFFFFSQPLTQEGWTLRFCGQTFHKYKPCFCV